MIFKPTIFLILVLILVVQSSLKGTNAWKGTSAYTTLDNRFRTIQPKPSTQASAGSFSGFTDSFKNDMANLLGQITNANNSLTAIFKDKLLIGLISIDNTLNLINKNKNQEAQLKPLLQYQVKNFLSDLDVVQEQLTRINSASVVGSNNVLIGKTGTIRGNNDFVIGGGNTVIGNGNALVGNNAIIAGNNNGVKGSNGITVGTNNQVNADNSYVFSNYDVVNQNNSLTIRDSTIDLDKLGSSAWAGYITRT